MFIYINCLFYIPVVSNLAFKTTYINFKLKRFQKFLFHCHFISADATLTFETELVSLKKRAGEQIIVRVIRFLAVPMAVIISIFYLYDKYKKAPTKKELKGDRRGKKKKH